MDAASKNLFARAALAGEEDGDFGFGNVFRVCHELVHASVNYSATVSTSISVDGESVSLCSRSCTACFDLVHC